LVHGRIAQAAEYAEAPIGMVDSTRLNATANPAEKFGCSLLERGIGLGKGRGLITRTRELNRKRREHFPTLVARRNANLSETVRPR